MNKLCFATITMSLMFVTACTEVDDVDNAERDLSSETLESPVTHDHSFGVTINATSADCPVGDICFYTGPNLTGSLCHWNVDDPDWASGAITCSWATTQNVCSVWNRAKKNIEYFTSANYANRIGSTNASVAGNLACTYKLRSHRCSSFFGGCF
jgi:hypothetical protein